MGHGLSATAPRRRSCEPNSGDLHVTKGTKSGVWGDLTTVGHFCFDLLLAQALRILRRYLRRRAAGQSLHAVVSVQGFSRVVANRCEAAGDERTQTFQASGC